MRLHSNVVLGKAPILLMASWLLNKFSLSYDFATRALLLQRGELLPQLHPFQPENEKCMRAGDRDALLAVDQK